MDHTLRFQAAQEGSTQFIRDEAQRIITTFFKIQQSPLDIISKETKLKISIET